MNETESLQNALPNKLQSILDASTFSIFQDIQDLGYFGWTPSGNYKSLHVVTNADIVKGLSFEGKPSRLLAAEMLDSQCPLKFKQTSTKHVKKNTFPYDPSYLVPLHVAVRDRQVDLNTIHFKLGGSALNMLANQTLQGSEYRVQLVPGTRILLVQKYAEYKINLSEPGFQFEQFCETGKLQHGNISKLQSFIHLQSMEVAGWKLLISAECDGMDQRGDPLEVKCTARPASQSDKVAFQMISSGSLSLYEAQRDATTLYGVQKVGLETVLKNAFVKPKAVFYAEKNLREGLTTLRRAVDDGKFDNGVVMSIKFHNRRLELNPLSLLPSESVVRAMLSSSEKVS